MRWIWPLWIVMIAVSFAIIEGLALASNKMTLSRFVWEASAAFPPLPFLAGFLVGFLACHFFWGGITSFRGLNDRQQRSDGS